jgi:hypothetical protein
MAAERRLVGTGLDIVGAGRAELGPPTVRVQVQHRIREIEVEGAIVFD